MVQPKMSSASLLDRRLRALERSAFRAKFVLGPGESNQLARKGTAVIRRHAYELLGARLAPAEPYRDGRQTPWQGHPVFVAQHATATCCRGCLARWHGIAKGRALAPSQLDYVVDVIMAWLARAKREDS